MPKNLGLGLAFKNSVRPKELLNNLGHSVSYNILRIDTTLTAGIFEANNGYSTVPTNRENIFTQATSDIRNYS